jgi:uncharacterized membrane protein YjjP (DUF1212 family)
MNYKLLLNFALLTGEIMLENGAETFRVEDTISRILKTSKCQTAEAFVTPTGIFASLDHPDMDLMTVVRRIKKRQINLNRIALANDISREFCVNELSLEAAMYQIQQVKNEPGYSSLIHICSTGLAAGFFALVFGGTISDMGVALIAGLVFGISQHLLNLIGASKFLIDIIGGMLCALIPFLFIYKIGLGNHFDLVVISSIMPMVPGVAITNAIRDTLNGELLSGVARATDAFIIAASIATGIGIMLSTLF